MTVIQKHALERRAILATGQGARQTAARPGVSELQLHGRGDGLEARHSRTLPGRRGARKGSRVVYLEILP